MTDEQDVSPRASVLREAEQLITGDRNVTYGSPTQNFATIGEMATARFKHKLRDGETITATDVADFMIIVKLARNIAQTKRDNYVDMAGYAGCGYETTLEDEKPAPKTGITIDMNVSPSTDTAVNYVRRPDGASGYLTW